MNGEYVGFPITVGNKTEFLKEKDRPNPDLTYKWTFYIKVQPNIIKSVQFRMHESFVDPIRNVTEPPFELVEHGWGEFIMQVKLFLFNGEKINISHPLRLYGNEYPLVYETHDIIIIKNPGIDPLPKYEHKFQNEEEESKNINDGIEYMLGLHNRYKENK